MPSDALGTLAELLSGNKTKDRKHKWLNAGISPLRQMYYMYWEHLHHEPVNIYDLFKGYSYILLIRGD